MSRLAALALALSLVSVPVRAEVELKTALPALLRVMTYDQNFEARGAGTFVVLVMSEPAQAQRRTALVDSLREAGVADIKKRPLKFVTADFRDEGQAQAEIDRHHPSAILVLPETSAAVLRPLWEVAQDNQLYALALDEAAVQSCFPIGVSLAGDKPQIVINERSARAVGVRFETSVLRLAKVIQ